MAVPDGAAHDQFQVEVQVPLVGAGAVAVADIIDELQTQINGLQSSEGDRPFIHFCLLFHLIPYFFPTSFFSFPLLFTLIHYLLFCFILFYFDQNY